MKLKNIIVYFFFFYKLKNLMYQVYSLQYILRNIIYTVMAMSISNSTMWGVP